MKICVLEYDAIFFIGAVAILYDAVRYCVKRVIYAKQYDTMCCSGML
jgi:hypothetical protein